MKKYNEEHFSVYHKRTGKKIADCGSREDARMLVNMDCQNREYRVNKMLMSEVIDIEIPKALPTNGIVDLGGKWDDPIPAGVDPYNLRGRGNELPEGKQKPFVV